MLKDIGRVAMLGIVIIILIGFFGKGAQFSHGLNPSEPVNPTTSNTHQLTSDEKEALCSYIHDMHVSRPNDVKDCLNVKDLPAISSENSESN